VKNNKSAHDTLVYRLSQVLQKLNQGESLDPQQLAAWDDGELKSFSVSKLEAVVLAPSTFTPRPGIEKELASSDGIWLGAQRQPACWPGLVADGGRANRVG
jgi:hypothetical protein